MVAAAASGASHGIKEYVEQQDCREPSVVRNGRTLRKKTEKVDKKFLTVGGEVAISRTVYQSSSGGSCYVPLDHAMGVVGHYALPDVRETICYLCSLVTTREAEDVTQRLAMFHPADKAIRNALADMGRWMEENEDDALADIAADEPSLPEADVMVVGMDGANVLLRERGKKKGRPAERPTIDDSTDETKSCHKNAMTGTISFYATTRGVKTGRQSLNTSVFPGFTRRACRRTAFRHSSRNVSGKSVPPNHEFHRIPSRLSSWTALTGFGDTLRKAASLKIMNRTGRLLVSVEMGIVVNNAG